MNEEMTSSLAINNAGQGKIDGIGVGPKGEPGVKKRKKLRQIIMNKTPLKRNMKEEECLQVSMKRDLIK